jgi:LysR family glycine cleavage system transcriptional activator
MADLPPLATLRYFEATARQLSMRRAAEELSITHGAVSQRIRALERYLGRPVFYRLGRKLVLTPEGEKLYDATSAMLERLRKVVGDIRGSPRRPMLNVTVGPYMGAHWLSPRLERFWNRHPDIELRLLHPYPVALHPTRIDVGILWGRGRWPGLSSEPLFVARSVPVCSPQFLRRQHRRPGRELVENATLLHSADRLEWTNWLTAAGLPVELAERGPIYQDTNVTMEAAMAGQGVAIGTKPIIDNEVHAGRLTLAHRHIVGLDETYHLAWAPEFANEYGINRFCSWLMQEAMP